MKGKKGQVIFFAFMIGLVILILALAFSPILKTFVENAMNPSNLDCANESISNFDKATCVVTDLSLFHFIGGLIFIAGAILTAKIILT